MAVERLTEWRDGAQLKEDGWDETEEEEESCLGADWLATRAGTGGTCTESWDSLPGAPVETYGRCHRSRATSLLSRCMMEPREILHYGALYPTDRHTPSRSSKKVFFSPLRSRWKERFWRKKSLYVVIITSLTVDKLSMNVSQLVGCENHIGLCSQSHLSLIFFSYFFYHKEDSSICFTHWGSGQINLLLTITNAEFLIISTHYYVGLFFNNIYKCRLLTTN